MDNLNDLQETKLWQFLNKIDLEYAGYSLVFAEKITPILNTISEYFPFYTEHNSIHSKNILNRIHQILNRECFSTNTKFSLSHIDAYLLICSSYAHDIGMTVFPGEEANIRMQLNLQGDDNWKASKKLLDYLRNNHSKRGYNYLLQNFEDLKIPRNLLSYLDYLMRAHNESTYSLKQGLLDKYAANSQPLNLPQLASILCIADALEFSDNRVKYGVLSQLMEKLEHEPNQDTLKSYQENMKNACISSNVTVNENGEVVVNGTFTDPDVLNLAHKTFDDIEFWLRDYLEIDNSYSVKRIRIRSPSIYRKLEYAFGDFERLGIRMKKENIINLISSNSLWGNNHSVVIKELIQNSVEACRYRQFNSSYADDYKPEITVEINNEIKAITVRDNGCGMSKDVILNNFLTVGNSRSSETDYKRKGYYSIAKFGIGFWSVFTVSKSAHIETTDFAAPDRGLSFDVSISLFTDYSVLKPITKAPGTTVSLQIKENINLNEIVAKIHDQVICSEIPITIVNKTTKTEITNEPQLIRKEELFGPKLPMAEKFQVQVFTFEESIRDYVFKMFITYRIANGKASFILPQNNRAIRWLYNMAGGYNITAICGFVTHVGVVYTVFQNNGVGGYIANMKNPQGFIFNINRRSLLPSKELTKYLHTLSLFLNKGYYKFLEQTNSLNNFDIYRITKESRQGMQGGIGNDLKQIQNAMQTYPQLFVSKLFKIEKGKTLDTCQVEYYNINSILTKDYSIISYEPFYSYHNSIHINEQNSGFIYNILVSQGKYEGFYFHEPNHLTTILFDSDETSYVENLKIKVDNFGEILSLPLTIFHSKSINVLKQSTVTIGSIQGIWSGAICLKKVIGNNFVFPYNRVIINPETQLANDIKYMYTEGDYLRVAEIINLLSLSEVGHIDESIRKYLL